MAQVVGCHLLAEETKIQFQASQCGICGEQSGTKTGFSPSAPIFTVRTNSSMLHSHSPANDVL